jgi:hypothetical protein
LLGGNCPLCECSVNIRPLFLLIGDCNRYLEAAKLNQGHEKYEDALKCAERGLEIDRDCLGIDHPLYQHSLRAVQELRTLR